MSEAGELSTVIKEQIKSFSQPTAFEDVGTVVTVGDGIAKIYGLDHVMNGELVQFSNGEFGMALNLEESVVGAVILGSDQGIKEGDPVKLTGRMAEVPVGDAMSGRVVNALVKRLTVQVILHPTNTYPLSAKRQLSLCDARSMSRSRRESNRSTPLCRLERSARADYR